MKRKIISLPPNYFYFCLISIVIFYFLLPNFNLINSPINFLGSVFLILGIYLIIKPYYLFKKHQTPESFDQSTYLVTDHLYKFSRNPMYLGGVIFLLGLAVCLGNVLAFVFPLLFFIIIDRMFIPFEEEKNLKAFGQQFIDYKKKVKRWL